MAQEQERVVYVFVMVEDGQILLRQRALTRKTEPGNFSATAAGHIEPNETPRQAAVRELREEAGIETTEEEMGQGSIGMIPKVTVRAPGRPDRFLEGYVYLIDRSGMSTKEIKSSSEHSGVTLLLNEGKFSELTKEIKLQRIAGSSRGSGSPPQIPMLPPGADMTNPAKEILLSRVGEVIRVALRDRTARQPQRSTS